MKRLTLAAAGRMWAVVSMSVLLIAMMLLFYPVPDDQSVELPRHGKDYVRPVEDSSHLTEMEPEEQMRMRRMLKPLSEPAADRFDRAVWTQDMQQVIGRWVSDDAEARSVARWVYVYSKHFKISPELVLAVIAVESRFDHFAVSKVGARGLMQVMPFWKQELGSKTDNLLDIETNVRYGCAILRTYLNRYGTTARALAAYNGSLGDGTYPARVYAQMKRFKASAQDLQGNG